MFLGIIIINAYITLGKLVNIKLFLYYIMKDPRHPPLLAVVFLRNTTF